MFDAVESLIDHEKDYNRSGLLQDITAGDTIYAQLRFARGLLKALEYLDTQGHLDIAYAETISCQSPPADSLRFPPGIQCLRVLAKDVRFEVGVILAELNTLTARVHSLFNFSPLKGELDHTNHQRTQNVLLDLVSSDKVTVDGFVEFIFSCDANQSNDWDVASHAIEYQKRFRSQYVHS